MSGKIEDCPFCESSAELKEYGNALLAVAHYVACTRCNARSSGYSNLDDAINAWNSSAKSHVLAAPVVERQPVLWVDAAYLRDHSNKSVSAFRKPTKHEPLALYAAPPELAELQATIAQLKDDLGAAKGEYDRSANKVTLLQDEIERLKGGQGEPVCPACKGSGEGWILYDASPDAHNIQVDCQECNGRGSLLGAYESMKTQLNSLSDRYVKADGELFFMRLNNDRLISALKFYADRDHYSTDDGLNWDSCSGEPSNILWHEEQPWFIEDGTVARACLDKVKELNQ